VSHPNVLAHAVTAAPPIAPAAAEYLTAEQLATLLHVTTRTALRWRRDGGGPAFVRCGARRVLYSRRAVDEWLASRSYAHLAAEAVARLPAA
jgi:excisionase family DNA binding protein